MCMTIKIVLFSPRLVALRLLTLSFKEHDPITKLHEQSVTKYCLNNTNTKMPLFKWEGEKKAMLENQPGLVLTL